MKGGREGSLLGVSNRFKIEYVVEGDMGIEELGTFLCASKVLWVYDTSDEARKDVGRDRV